MTARDAENPLADQVRERVPNLPRCAFVGQTPGERLDQAVHALGRLGRRHGGNRQDMATKGNAAAVSYNWIGLNRCPTGWLWVLTPTRNILLCSAARAGEDAAGAMNGPWAAGRALRAQRRGDGRWAGRRRAARTTAR